MSPKELTRGNWPTTADSIFGMTPTYINSTQTDSYIAAFLLAKHLKSRSDVTHPPMEVITRLTRLMQRFGKVDSTGQICIKMPKSSSEGVLDANGKGT